MDKLARALRLKTDPGVFFACAGIILGFVIVASIWGPQVAEVFGAASAWIMEYLGWFYIAGVSIFLLYLIGLALSRFGHAKIGDDHEVPEYSTPVWFAMLFAAGIGSILMFWGVAEPISHFATPPRAGVEAGTSDAAREAMAITLYHFGLHTWTIFALPAVAFAYFIYKRKMPPRVSSIFSPLLGPKVYGPIGKAIDVFAVVGTVFGIAVSVGLGTLQINAGLSDLWGIEISGTVQLLIIVVMTTIASISVGVGLDRGIKMLSNINIVLAIVLLIFVIVAGPTLYLLKGIVESFGIYAANLPELAFWNNTFPASDDLEGWQNTWTVFYWAWTICWAPFVGIFIARISKGRTIREFVFGVLALPVTFTIIWYAAFGFSAVDMEINGEGGIVTRVVDEGDVPGALFAFLANYPWFALVAGLAMLIVIIFFTTSVDSAALVIDMMVSGQEDTASPWYQRVLWAVAVGAVTAVLLVSTAGDGLTALQETIIVIGLPFFVMGFLMMWSLYVAIRNDLGDRAPVISRSWDEARDPESWERNEEAPTPEPRGASHYIPGENGDSASDTGWVVGDIEEPGSTRDAPRSTGPNLN